MHNSLRLMHLEMQRLLWRTGWLDDRPCGQFLLYERLDFEAVATVGDAGKGAPDAMQCGGGKVQVS